MTERDLNSLRTQLAAARTRAPMPTVTIAEISLALADHIRFEVACGHEHTAEQLAVIRDQLSTLPRIGTGR